MIFKYIKIFKNELCPCGSGVKYGVCCYKRKDKKIDDVHLQKLMLDIARNFDSCKYEVCLHPNQNECKPPIKHAHSIQNHGVLSQISYNNHVIAFRTDKTQKIDAKQVDNQTVQIQFKMESIGVNQATTQTCFCNYHDSTLFAPIESNPKGFQKDSTEQLFIYAYKAFAFEYYKSKVAQTALQKLFKTIPQKLKKFPLLFVPGYRQQQFKNVEMEYYKSFFDKAILHKEYTGIITKIVEIPYKIAFATTECITPMFDLRGKRVPNIVRHEMRRMFISIFPNNTSSFVLISYLEADKKCFETYVDLLLSLKQSDLFEYLSVFLPLYSENIVLSPKLWKQWGVNGQSAFNAMINTLEKEVAKSEFRLTSNINFLFKHKEELPKCSCNLFKAI